MKTMITLGDMAAKGMRMRHGQTGSVVPVMTRAERAERVLKYVHFVGGDGGVRRDARRLCGLPRPMTQAAHGTRR
jgi:hypothetical protein